ncbi:PAS domain-containing protein [Spirulina subsalsa]|uniref:PAS domain-containing protein n=1 Tax=Spirulina subsalsa TaxID=54311 RepID=UPI0002E778FE|nr:PAS domain-containing protein [Spirulina subsalsa]
MSETNQDHLWRLIWKYDPNALIVVDADMHVKLVNPAFCTMFNVQTADIIDQPVSLFLDEDDIQDFKQVWETNEVIRGKEKEYSQYHLYVNQVIFPIEDQSIVACIMVNMTHELDQKRELRKIKNETIKKVNEVVDNQMKVVQEIAGLLGETTAETKVSLLKIIQMLEQD